MRSAVEEGSISVGFILHDWCARPRVRNARTELSKHELRSLNCSFTVDGELIESDQSTQKLKRSAWCPQSRLPAAIVHSKCVALIPTWKSPLRESRPPEPEITSNFRRSAGCGCRRPSGSRSKPHTTRGTTAIRRRLRHAPRPRPLLRATPSRNPHRY